MVAVCDLQEAVLERFRAVWGTPARVETYADHREMLEQEDVEVLSVVTSDHRHGQIVIDAAEAGSRPSCARSPWPPPSPRRSA